MLHYSVEVQFSMEWDTVWRYYTIITLQLQLIVVMSLYHYGHRAHAQEVYLWKTIYISWKQEKVILTKTTFIPLVIEQLKILRLNAIIITLCICWKEIITISHMHLPNAIIYLQTNLSNIVIKVLAGSYNYLRIQIQNRQLQLVTGEISQPITMIV